MDCIIFFFRIYLKRSKLNRIKNLTDPWLSDIPFNVRFGRLFELTDNPLMSVADMVGYLS
jgi:hypothetical protein